ncbi:hypothetical protein AAEO57_19875 [Flavobacterium sp. DGU38]|uniref:Uncharacterized protein n=1 Tax=Flavobacterium calami TaxID=3139144 RepID=A0ABU9IVP1_9FLAO
MNPFNLLISYVIANSRASFYNVQGNQEITNTALLTGMISENPILSYLIIENKARSEGDKFTGKKVAVKEIGNNVARKDSETSSLKTGNSETSNVLTLEGIKNEDATNDVELKS